MMLQLRLISWVSTAALLSLVILLAMGEPNSFSDCAYASLPPDGADDYWEDSTIQPCLPRYSDYQHILQLNETSARYEANPTPADFNGDGLEDIVVDRVKFQTRETFEIDILLNDGHGGMIQATSSIFTNSIPKVQNPTQVVVADFNGDDRSDIFIADHGYDVSPHPGYQNTLVLTAPDGKLIDATSNLPQRHDFTHSACAADIDDDGDIDLYVGNIWGLNDIDPQLLRNDGDGEFTVGWALLPVSLRLSENGYTTCEFLDVNNDGAPDLILGDAGDGITNAYSTPTSEVLINSGKGVFRRLRNAMPPKGHAPSDIAHDIVSVDLNGDEFMDLFIVYERQPAQGSYIQALVNNGDGTFRDETELRLESTIFSVWIPSLELRDLNNDDALDLLALHDDYWNPDPILFLNDGEGRFALESYDFGLKDLYYTFIDLDRDKGNDILLTLNYPPDHVYVVRDLGCD